MTRPILSCAALPALLLSTAGVAAMPPPVAVAPLVLSAPENAIDRAELVKLIEAMGKEGHFALAAISQDDQALDACWKVLQSERSCLAKLAPIRVEAEPELTVVIDTPEWRMAAVRVRCIGPDVSRAREIQLYLLDARTGRPNALQEKAKLAGCMIGAVYGSPTERG